MWMLVLSAVLTTGTQTGSLSGRVVGDDGAAIAFAHVVLVGTTIGTNTAEDGSFHLARVPVGTYHVKSWRVDRSAQTHRDVAIEAGGTTRVDFRLALRTYQTQTFRVTFESKVDPKLARSENKIDAEGMRDLPVEEMTEVWTAFAGVSAHEGDIVIRTARPGDVSFYISGVPTDDPLSNGTIDVSLLSVADSEVITGGMEAEYGNAGGGIIRVETRAGGPEFTGNVRYRTDDYGRPDKTFTNYDRLALGFGGPTPFRDLTFYVSGEATFIDGDVLSARNYPQRKYLGGSIRVKERAATSYRTQARADWHLNQSIRFSAEYTLDRSRNDPYVHNWNTPGYVTQVVIFPQLGPSRFDTSHYAYNGTVRLFKGPWQEQAQSATYIDIMEDPECVYCLLPTSGSQRIRAVRVGPSVYAAIDEPLFQGAQYPVSDWVPELTGAPGDTSRVAYNAAEHTLRQHSVSQRIKWSMKQSLSRKSFYEVHLSRLSFSTLSTVNGKTPEQFDTAGRFIWDPTSGPRRIGNADFYTDPDQPYFVTANDYPAYLRRDSISYLLKSDITTQDIPSHKLKAGLVVQYHDLDNVGLTQPGLQAVFQGPQGLGQNRFRNFHPEGAFYVQDRFEYEGMVMSAGLRYDFFSPGSGIGIEIHSSEIPRQVRRWKTQWSPRLGLAFPITERDAFHFHYGRFIRFPDRNFLFATQDVNNAAGILGNPDLDPETSVSYQAGIKHQFTTLLSAQFAVFHRDFYGLVSSVPVVDDSSGTQNQRFVNRAFASGRGLEVSLHRTFSRGFSYRLAYTYSFADGVASRADFGVRAQGLSYIPNSELPLDWDERHALTVNLVLARPGDWSVSFMHRYGSGKPWTPSFRFEKAQDPLLENSRRFPATNLLSLRGEKFFSINGTQLRFFFDGKNLLGQRYVADIDPVVAPGLIDATAAYREYATETGRFGGAYLQDRDADGADEFIPVNDPRVYAQGRVFQVGVGYDF